MDSGLLQNDLKKIVNCDKDIKKMKHMLPLSQYDRKEPIFVASCCQLNVTEGDCNERIKTENPEEEVKKPAFVKIKLNLLRNRPYGGKKQEESKTVECVQNK